MLWATIGCALYVLMLFVGYLFIRGAAEIDRPSAYPNVFGRRIGYRMTDLVRK